VAARGAGGWHSLGQTGDSRGGCGRPAVLSSDQPVEGLAGQVAVLEQRPWRSTNRKGRPVLTQTLETNEVAVPRPLLRWQMFARRSCNGIHN
jgi:hypothetical protein